MKRQSIVFAALILFLSGGILFSLSGATPGTAAPSRWAGDTAGSVITEGGNITSVNVASVSLTDRWAAFYGNVTGSINLTNGSYNVYFWAWSAGSGGEVCLSTATSAATFGSTLTAATAANVNSGFSLGSAVDNATNTLAATNCTLNFAQATVSSAPYVKHTLGTFYTCAVNDGSGATKADFLFCTNISNPGTAFNGQNASYEIMVPTAPGTGTETYYFYAELN